VDLKKKITEALRRTLQPDHIILEDDDGISGFVVSAQFQQVPSLERQKIIHDALHDSTVKFTKAELRQVLAIAALTPVEYEALGHNGK
jgi:hypothetical protein